MGSRSCQIITLANIKGGVGKTSATVNIGYLLATQLNKKVLIIDSDDQGNASKSLSVRGQYDRDKETLWYALKHRKTYLDVCMETPYQNLWLIPAAKELSQAQLTFGQSARGMKLMKKLLQGCEKDFDFVLIDTKPQINIILQSSLAASHWYLIPSFPETDSYDGFIDLVSECEEIYEEENENLNCLGVIFTCVKKCVAHETYMSFIIQHLKKAQIKVFNQLIKSSHAVATGTLQNVPAVALSSSHNLKQDYLDLTQAIQRDLVRRGRRKDQKRPKLDVLGIQMQDISDQPMITDFCDSIDHEIDFN